MTGAPHGHALRVRRPHEPAGVSRAAEIPERPEEHASRRHVHAERRRGARTARAADDDSVQRVDEVDVPPRVARAAADSAALGLPGLAKLEHPLSKRLRMPTDPRACAAAALDQPLATEKVQRAHDRRPADAQISGESAFRGQTRPRPQPPSDNRGAQLVSNLCITRPAVPHIDAYAPDHRVDLRPVHRRRRSSPLETGRPLAPYGPLTGATRKESGVREHGATAFAFVAVPAAAATFRASRGRRQDAVRARPRRSFSSRRTVDAHLTVAVLSASVPGR